MTSEKIIGIDLGTTNSVVAVMEGSEPEIIENERGNRVTPSVVALKEDLDGSDEWIIGETAANQEKTNPEGTARSFKRLMGTDETITLHDTSYTPEELSAKIIRSLKEDAEKFLGYDNNDTDALKKAVITVPAYFTSRQRRATRDAAEIAGLHCVETLDEPTAAALAYARRDAATEETNPGSTKKEHVLVADLGGGTFDVTVMEYGGAIDNVLATSGNNELGGDDWDNALAEYLAEQIEEDLGVNPLTDPDVGLDPKLRIKREARKAKHELTSTKEVTLNLPYLPDSDGGVGTFTHTLTRARFENVTADLHDEVLEPIHDAIDEAGENDDPHKPSSFTKQDIDKVILVGGSTRMPHIQELIETEFSSTPKSSINPDEVVAKGAAYKAASYSGEVQGVTLLDVVPISIGLKVRNGLFERIIPKNKTRPIEVSRTFTTAAANQTSVNIEVFQGERDLAENNDKLGEFVLTGIPPAPAGTPQIDVTFSVDDDGILAVKATESVTGVSEEVTIEGRENGLTQDDVDRLKREAEEHADDDIQRRENISIRNDAEKAVQRAHTILSKHEDVISPDLASQIHERVDEVEKYLDIIRSDESLRDYNDVRDATTRLDRAVEQVGRDVYQPDDAFQDESINVEEPELDSKSAVPSKRENTDT